MEGYQVQPPLHIDPVLGLQVFELSCPTRFEDLIVKQYLCSSYEEGDVLLKEAISLASRPFFSWAAFVGVKLATAPSPAEFTVNFMFHKISQEVPKEAVIRSDRVEPLACGLTDYTKGRKLCKKQGDPCFCIREAHSERLNQDVVIMTYKPFVTVEKANEFIKEAFIQAMVKHENNVGVVDVAMCRYPQPIRGFKLHIVMENLRDSLDDQVKSRHSSKQRFSEAELLCFLTQVSAGLLHAKQRVLLTQMIAHRELKPENIFLGCDGKYKIRNYVMGWERMFEARLPSMAGLPFYFSPQRKLANDGDTTTLNFFAGDVYSLGVTCLYVATGHLPAALNAADKVQLKYISEFFVSALPYSSSFKQVLSGMLEVEASQRLTIEAVSATLKKIVGRGTVEKNESANLERLTLISRTLETECNSLSGLSEEQQADFYAKGSKISIVLGQHFQAEDFASKSLNLRRRALGEIHSETATAYLDLSVVKERMGNLPEAEKCALSCLSIRVSTLGETHAETANAHARLAMLYRKMEQLPDAEKHALAALSIRQDKLGDSHDETANAHYDMSIVYWQNGKFAEAEIHTRKFLGIRETAQGEKSGKVANACYNLSVLCRQAGRLVEAERYAMKCLTIRQQIVANAPSELLLYENSLSTVLGRFPEAASLYRNSLLT